MTSVTPTSVTNDVQGISRLEELGNGLNEQVQTLMRYLRSSGLPQPSFDRNTPQTVLHDEAPEHVKTARESLMESAMQIFQLASGPSDYLANVITGQHYIVCLQWLSHFGIFELVPLEGAISYSDLAHQATVSESRLKSIARMAMTNRLFTEPTSNSISHTAESAALVSNQHWRDQRVWISEHIVPSMAATVRAHEKWPHDTDKTHTPFNLAFETNLPMYDYISENGDLFKLFGRVMKALTSSPKSDMKHVLKGFDWAALGKGLVVDVGGNNGHSSVVLAKAFPDLEFIVEDLPHVIDVGHTQVQSENDSSVSARINFQSHDFFTTQTVIGADVYFLRQIFHNWDSDNCVKILSSLLPALKSNSHIVIMDFVLPDAGSVPAVTERVLRSRDIGMMQLFNSMERDLEEWKAIFTKVDSRIKLNKVIQPFGSSMSMLDLVLEE